MVHGEDLSVRAGKRIGHAWCERGEAVIDLAMPVGMREFGRDAYCGVLKPAGGIRGTYA